MTTGKKFIATQSHFQKMMIPFTLLVCTAFQSFAGHNDSLTTRKDSVKILQPAVFSIAQQINLVSDKNYNDIRAGLIYDVTSNTIVWQKDLNTAYPIASLTKMMVALIGIEAIKSGKADWQDEINATSTYKKSRRSRKTDTAHNTYTLEGLMKMAMIPSNNEACMLIAKHLSGDVETFVQRMNARAFSLQMNQTFFSNPSGLPSGSSAMDNSSTPKDLLILATELIKYDEILNITDIGFAEVPNGHGSPVFRNHNHLVIDYPDEVDGLKTGYTRNARFCLVATAKKNNHRLIAIALGARNPGVRNAIVADMLSNYYQTLGLGRMGNQPDQPLYASNQNATIDSSATASLTNSVTVYKTITTIIKERHTVKRGETLGAIATLYHCSVNEIKRWNHLRNSRVNKGQNLFVHVHSKKMVPVRVTEVENYDACEDDAPCGPDATQENQNVKPVEKKINKTKHHAPVYAKKELKSKFVYHQVQPGDTLWSIAQQYHGVTVGDIKRWNRINSSKGLKAGSKLKIALHG
jgi:D-alanyl-D-alanine carboxypeptidase (penicillin-binding protein 5/6)